MWRQCHRLSKALLKKGTVREILPPSGDILELEFLHAEASENLGKKVLKKKSSDLDLMEWKHGDVSWAVSILPSGENIDTTCGTMTIL